MGFPSFQRWEVYGFAPAGGQLLTTGDPPWRAIDAWAYDAEDRAYALEVWTRTAFVAALEDPVEVELVPLAVAWHSPVWVTRECEVPAVVVDDTAFDDGLLDLLTYGSDEVRMAAFLPLPTVAEIEELDRFHDTAEDDVVARALAALGAHFGPGWRIEAGEAHAAAQVLADLGLLATGPGRLFTAARDRFSTRARQIIRRHLSHMAPPHY